MQNVGMRNNFLQIIFKMLFFPEKIEIHSQTTNIKVILFGEKILRSRDYTGLPIFRKVQVTKSLIMSTILNLEFYHQYMAMSQKWYNYDFSAEIV